MAKKPISFPALPTTEEPPPLSRYHSRLIFSIGDRRLAFDFFSKVTELNQTPARILPFNSEKSKKAPKSRD